MTKHTPGPWKQDEPVKRQKFSKFHVTPIFAEDGSVDGTWVADTTVENAPMIIAAPDMYYALAKIAALPAGRPNITSRDAVQARDIARAAIAKADPQS